MEYDDLLHPAQLGRGHLDAGSPLAHVAQLHHRIFYENPFTSELNVNPESQLSFVLLLFFLTS